MSLPHKVKAFRIKSSQITHVTQFALNLTAVVFGGLPISIELDRAEIQHGHNTPEKRKCCTLLSAPSGQA
jgi:hypothetical protein